MHLGVVLDRAGHHPAAWRERHARPDELFTARWLVDLVRTAERGGLDLVVVEDDLEPRSEREDEVSGRLDALLSLARVAPETTTIGLVPVVTTTHTEPFHVAKNVATLDLVSGGRAGWKVSVSTTDDAAQQFGRKPAAAEADLYEEAADTIEVVRRLWDSWEDGAVIRDVATGRYLDRSKVHCIDFEGRFFSVRGPSITPRSPQGQPLVVMDATPAAALDVATRQADIIVIEARDLDAAQRAAEHVRRQALAAGRSVGEVAVLAVADVLLASTEADASAERARLDSLAEPPPPSTALDFVGTPQALADLAEAWFGSGAVDGFLLRPALLPRSLDQLVDEVVPRLRERGLLTEAAPCQLLRERFGWGRPANRYATGVAGGTTAAEAPTPTTPDGTQPRTVVRRRATTSSASSRTDGRPRKQVHLAAHFPGVNNTTVWSDPTSGSQTDFASFVHLAQTAERGCFDFFFLAEGLRLREHRGQIFDLDVVGRPDSLTVLAALAALTERIGLAATLNTTFNEPYELARQFASLDHLSAGRAAWNAVTSPDAFTGENFRRGGFLDPALRYPRAEELIATCRELWDTWADDAVLADRERAVFVPAGAVRPFEHHGDQFSISGQFDVPRSPQGYPVMIQAGDSDGGRELAAAHADVIFSRHAGFTDGQRFYADVKARLPRFGRRSEDLKIIPAATVVLGDTEAEAHERADLIRHQQVSPQGALAFLEQIWGRDLSAYDPEGPLPEVDPDVGGTITRGRVRHEKDPMAVAEKWRSVAAERDLSIREVVIEMTTRTAFVGTPSQVAEKIDTYVQADAADGYILVPHLTPHGLDDFVDLVVPELQERGAFRVAYDGPTLRDHLGLARPSSTTTVASASGRARS
jgi:FMN-dependent oxidoreductase (nitrilotriacetate monooxygenase family)